MEIKELSFEPKWREDAKRAYYTIESMGKQIMSITEREVRELLEGAIDMHVHAFPDPLIDTGWNQLDIVKKATEEGMKAIVFKAHTFPTATTVPFVQEAVINYAETIGKEPVKVFGGITLNNYVGGLNPASVEMAARIGAKVVWLPSHDSAHHHRVLEQPGGIEVLDSKKKPLPELRKIFDLVNKYDMILDPCHCGTEEKLIIIEEAKKAGVKRIIITHPNWNVTKASIEEQAEMGEMGAYIGLFMYGAIPHFNNPNCDPGEALEIIKKVKPEHIVIATDLGTVLNVHPVEGMKLFLRVLLACGIEKDDIEKMVKKNPACLLGLD